MSEYVCISLKITKFTFYSSKNQQKLKKIVWCTVSIGLLHTQGTQDTYNFFTQTTSE